MEVMESKLKEVFQFGTAHSTSIGVAQDKDGGYFIRYQYEPVVKMLIDEDKDTGMNIYEDWGIGTSKDSKEALINMVCSNIARKIKFELKNALSEEMSNSKSFQYTILLHKDWNEE